MTKKNEELNPSEYFNNLKDKIQNITDEELVEFYQGCLTLVEKYKITGQKRKYFRVGKCLRCGKCCRNIGILLEGKKIKK